MDQQAQCGYPASLAFPLPALFFRIGLVVLALASTTAWTQSAMDGFLPSPNGIVRAISVQSDGYILAGGDFTQVAGTNRRALARVRADGSVDAGFNAQIGNGEVHAIAVQADGRILIGGTFTQIGVSQRLRIARLQPDGSLDASFNPGANATVRALLTEADGSILAGGDFTQFASQPRNALARVSATGALESTFQPNPSGSVHALALLPDGRIWVGGIFTDIGGQGRTNLARLLPEGGVDATLPRMTNGPVRSIVVDIDGSTLIGGDFTQFPSFGPGIAVSRNRLARYGVNNLLSPFNPNADGPVETVIVMPDGHVIAGGQFTSVGGQQRRNIARVAVTGSVAAELVGYRPNGRVHALAVDAAGSLLIGGDFWEDIGGGGPYIPRLARFQSPQVDHSLWQVGPNNSVLALAADSEGRMLVGGSFSTFRNLSRTLAARVTSWSGADSFNPIIVGAAVHAMAVLEDGHTLLGGSFSTVNGFSRPNLVRFPGLTGFNPAPNGLVYAIGVQPDGKILVAGSFTVIGGQSRFRLARLHPNGNLDTDFINPQIGWVVRTLMLQTDGKIIIGGEFNEVSGQPRAHIARLNADGSLDLGFNPGANDLVRALALDAQGRILVGGQFHTLGGQPRDSLARLMPDGSVDPTFSPLMGNWVTSIAPLVDGRIMVTGGFLHVDGITRMGTARLFADGSLDLGYEAHATMPALVYAMAVYPEGKIMVGGDFTTLVGRTMSWLGRLSVPEPVISKLEVSGETVTWRRGGVAPEVAFAPELLFSDDGVNFAPIAVMNRVPEGWAVQGFEQPVGEIFHLQVRARVTSGFGNGSSGHFRVTGRFFGMQTPLPDQIMADRFEQP